MFLDVSIALKHPGEPYAFRVEQEIAPQEIGGETITFDPAVLEGTYSTEEEQVTVEGELRTVAHAMCANCLAPAQAEVRVPFRETFLRDADPEDDEQYAYSGSAIGFEKLAMSLSVLNLPMRFLCKEDCQGLLKQYGGDIETTARQKELQKEHPFAALQQLLTKDEEV